MPDTRKEFKSEKVAEITGGKTGSEGKAPKEESPNESTGRNAEKGNN